MAGRPWSEKEHAILVATAPLGVHAVQKALAKAGIQRTTASVHNRAGHYRIAVGADGHPPNNADVTVERRRLFLKLAARADRITLRELADQMDMAPRKVEALVEAMAAEGHRIQITPEGEVLRQRQPDGLVPRYEHTFKGKVYRFGLISDTHFASKYADLDGVHQAYEMFRAEGIENVYHAGNIAEGQDSYPGQANYLTRIGAHEQAEEVAERLPKIKGIRSHFIGSSTCHEGAYFKRDGLEFGILVSKTCGRADLHYLGLDSADIVLRGERGHATMRLMHPGGGMSYALSYRPQKLVESISGGEKPNILVIGHFHKFGYFDVRNVHTYLAGCLQFQTPFMLKHAIEAHRGFWIVEATIEADGSVTRLKDEKFRFYRGKPQEVRS